MVIVERVLALAYCSTWVSLEPKQRLPLTLWAHLPLRALALENEAVGDLELHVHLGIGEIHGTECKLRTLPPLF